MKRTRGVALLLLLSVVSIGCGGRVGIDPTPLSTEPGAELGAAFSPDGTSLAYEWASTDGESDIWVIDLATETKRRVTYAPGLDSNPAWSPDGKRIVFDSTRDGGRNIYVVDAAMGEGKDPQQRARALTSGEAASCNPAWSPDGKRIAFDCNAGGRPDVCLMNVDGSARTTLTRSTSDDVHPAWSPDGALLAFSSTRTGQKDIWMTNADGSHPRRLTVDREDEWDPVWAPDGKHVVYVRAGESGTRGFYEIYYDGRGAEQVFESYKDLRDPAVSPDGKQIAFSANPEGDYNLYLVQFETPQ